LGAAVVFLILILAHICHRESPSVWPITNCRARLLKGAALGWQR
jgi:hypothetical protein